MKLPLLFIALATVGLSPTPHQFEDGFVERTMAIVVRGDTAYVEYSVGLNQATLQEVLAIWEEESESDPAPTTGKTAIPNPTGPKQPLPSQTNSDSATPRPENAAGDQNRFVQPPGKTEDIKDTGLKATHYIAPELLSRFKTLAKTEIPKRLITTLDGKPVDLKEISEGVAPRHPFTLQIKFQFKIPATKSCELKITDANFGDQTGAVRYALKASGDAFLLQSNVAPILVRSERVELMNLSKPERSLQTLIQAKLAIVRSAKD